MARKLKITENEKYTLQDVKYGEENWKRWKIQKCPLQDVEYGKKTEKDRKSVVQGKSVDLGGRRIIKKKNFFQAEDGIRDVCR